jgi:hypothetical protein
METFVTGVRDAVLLYYKEILRDQYHRYRSWEHCYSHFQGLESTRSEQSIDTTTLHLAFYLASWGMYRGSSQLLQKNYQVHAAVVRELLRQEYSCLWHLDFDLLAKESQEVNLVFELAKRLRSIYADLHVSPTDTLVTKVLLGTFGCIPAYDTLFINGVTYWNEEVTQGLREQFPARFGVGSYRGLIGLYRAHKREFMEAREFIAGHSMNYPPMKLVDMYFWSLGNQLVSQARTTAPAG